MEQEGFLVRAVYPTYLRINRNLKCQIKAAKELKSCHLELLKILRNQAFKYIIEILRIQTLHPLMIESAILTHKRLALLIQIRIIEFNN